MARSERERAKESGLQEQSSHAKWLGGALLVIGFVLALAVALGQPIPPSLTVISNETFTGAAATNLSDNGYRGGNIITVNLDATDQNENWKGFVGNVSGSLVLADASGYNLYSWGSVSSIIGRVYVSRNESITWATIDCADNDTVLNEERYFNHSYLNNPQDNINETFLNPNSHQPFDVGTVSFVAGQCNYSIDTFVNGVSDVNSTYEEILLQENAASSFIVYATIINQSGPSFKDTLTSRLDYQMIVPENATADTASTYFFYVELE